MVAGVLEYKYVVRQTLRQDDTPGDGVVHHVEYRLEYYENHRLAGSGRNNTL